MEIDPVLYTLPQWFVFAGIICSVYGWVEHKRIFRLLGPLFFLLLGLFALWTLMKGEFAPVEYLTPDEIISEEMEEPMANPVPIQVQLFPAYLSFVISGLLAIPAAILEWKNHRFRLWVMIFTALTALFGFFIIVGALRSI